MDDLEKFAEDLLKISEELEGGKSAEKFLEKEGANLKNEVLDEAKSKVKAHSGNYFKSIKAGDVYKPREGNEGLSIDAYSASGLAHLIENGHIIKGRNKKDGSEGDSHGFKKGYHVFDNAAKNYKEEFENNVEIFKNKIFEKNGF